MADQMRADNMEETGKTEEDRTCRPKPQEDLSWRDLNGELVAINVNSGEYHVFNGVGRLIWLGLTEQKSREQTMQQIMHEYNVEQEKASSDIDAFIEDLLKRGLLILS